jgi:nitroimidazol reductase NimA-like FMN-containing flavoprotein (pyridoxamine 5'-phosphate oxidase superfamily)
MVINLATEECKRALESVPIGRVALSVDALPAIVPVTFKLIGDSIVFGAMAGSRLARATANSIVAFLADSYDLDSQSGWWVEVLGPASWITDPDELSQLRGELTEPWVTGERLDHAVRIELTEVKGCRIDR